MYYPKKTLLLKKCAEQYREHSTPLPVSPQAIINRLHLYLFDTPRDRK